MVAVCLTDSRISPQPLNRNSAIALRQFIRVGHEISLGVRSCSTGRKTVTALLRWLSDALMLARLNHELINLIFGSSGAKGGATANCLSTRRNSGLFPGRL
jgi:hypothetical protein